MSEGPRVCDQLVHILVTGQWLGTRGLSQVS